MLLRNFNLLDVLSGEIREGWSLQVEDGRIFWIGEEDRVPGAGEPVDLGGATVMPGLINCHVHLSYGGEADPSTRVNRGAGEEALVAARHACQTLNGGVTTVRDCGSPTRAATVVREAVSRGRLAGPRVLSSGRLITMTGGHGHWTGVEVDGADGVRTMVREEIKHGADWIKFAASGGVLTPGTLLGAPSFTAEEMAAGVEAAAFLGRRVAAHAIGTEGIKNALRAGVTSIEHGSYLDAEAIEMMLERDATHVPTLSAYYNVIHHGVEGGVPQEAVNKAAGAHEDNRNSLVRSLEAGVNVAVGTDAGTPFNSHGGVALELELMVDAGASPLQALQSGTINAARNLGIESFCGSIEKGKSADLLVLDRSPFEDLNVLREPRAVMVAGSWAPPCDTPEGPLGLLGT
ncbi:amidohydrolase family protein [Egibacter rhizosphaerae]|uniref:Amidohydrolase family protein n=1 Tax=Egibacter rhizosphaerae TaxID=1670831 RepID=A0A411YFX7_9ACTN|nr:amidohydrolase family protein [Egibacter rhizosphaerae]QBI20079.1 amidohydrolase family protein [Egibacter rhizosphaerae]